MSIAAIAEMREVCEYPFSMKLGKPIGDEEYERRLNILVQKFCDESERHAAPTGYIGRIYQVIATSERPLDYQEISDKIGLTALASRQRIAQRLSYLVETGWIIGAGYSEARYKNHQAQRYAPSGKAHAARLYGCLSAFEKAVALLDQRRTRASCMAVTVRPKIDNLPEREREMVEARLKGRSLQDIGYQFGITRERVRQIIERSMSPEESRLQNKRRVRAMKVSRTKTVICHEIRKIRGGFIADIAGEETLFATFEALINELRRLSFPEDLTENHKAE